MPPPTPAKILATEADCASHSPRNTKTTTEDLAAILECGKNVVSSALLPALYGPSRHVSRRGTDRMDQACRNGRTSLWVSDVVEPDQAPAGAFHGRDHGAEQSSGGCLPERPMSPGAILAEAQDVPFVACLMAASAGLSVACSVTSGQRDIQTESSGDLSTQTFDGESVPGEPTYPRSRLLVGPQILFRK